jgi:hypothetical protein
MDAISLYQLAMVSRLQIDIFYYMEVRFIKMDPSPISITKQ